MKCLLLNGVKEILHTESLLGCGAANSFERRLGCFQASAEQQLEGLGWSHTDPAPGC